MDSLRQQMRAFLGDLLTPLKCLPLRSSFVNAVQHAKLSGPSASKACEQGILQSFSPHFGLEIGVGRTFEFSGSSLQHLIQQISRLVKASRMLFVRR